MKAYKPCLNEQLGLYAGSKAPNHVKEYHFHGDYFIPLKNIIGPKIKIARLIALGSLLPLALYNGLEGLYLWLVVMALYGCSEFYYQFCKKTTYVLGELENVAPDSRHRNGNALICYDVDRIVVYAFGSVTVIPANQIASVKVLRIGNSNSPLQANIKLHGSDKWVSMADGVTYDIVDMIRHMNPHVTTPKWWQ